MAIITQTNRYLPHEISTKMKAVETYSRTKGISYVCLKYHFSKASLMRRNKQYDGKKESLLQKSHHPHTQHPNAHTEEELKWIRDYHTTEQLGIKWQMDVKYVPEACYTGSNGEKFYQYTMLEEALIYPYREHSSYSTQDLVKRAILYYGYAP